MVWVKNIHFSSSLTNENVKIDHTDTLDEDEQLATRTFAKTSSACTDPSGLAILVNTSLHTANIEMIGEYRLRNLAA